MIYTSFFGINCDRPESTLSVALLTAVVTGTSAAILAWRSARTRVRRGSRCCSGRSGGRRFRLRVGGVDAGREGALVRHSVGRGWCWFR